MTKQVLKTEHNNVRFGASPLRFLRMLAFCTLLGMFVAFHTTADASEASRQSARLSHENNPLSYLWRLFTNAVRGQFQARGLSRSELDRKLEEEVEERKRKAKKDAEEDLPKKAEEVAKMREMEEEEAIKEEERNREARRKQNEARRKQNEARRKQEEEEEEEKIRSGYYEKKYGGIHHKNALRERIIRQIIAERNEREARRNEEEEERRRSGYYEKEYNHGRGDCGCTIRQDAKEEEENIYNAIYEGRREPIGEEEIRREAFNKAIEYHRNLFKKFFEDEEEREREREKYFADWHKKEEERIRSGYYEKKYGEEGIHHKDAIRERILGELAAERTERHARRREEEQERTKSGYYEKKYGKDGIYHKSAIKERILRELLARDEEEKIYNSIYEGRREPIGEEEIRKEAFHKAYMSSYIFEPKYDKERGYRYIDYDIGYPPKFRPK